MINNSVSINCHLVFFSSIIQYGLPFTVINDLMGIFTSNKEKIYKQRKKPPVESFRKGRLFTIRIRDDDFRLVLACNIADATAK